MAAYVSELTTFLRDLKQARPEIERKQREGRALWWDRNPDPEEQERFGAARVGQPAYVYYAPEKPGESLMPPGRR